MYYDKTLDLFDDAEVKKGEKTKKCKKYGEHPSRPS
jgi:hypothetical protein